MCLNKRIIEVRVVVISGGGAGVDRKRSTLRVLEAFYIFIWVVVTHVHTHVCLKIEVVHLRCYNSIKIFLKE